MKHFGSNLTNSIHIKHLAKLLLISIFLFSFQNTYAKGNDINPQIIDKFNKFICKIPTSSDRSATMTSVIAHVNALFDTINMTQDNLKNIPNLLDCIYHPNLKLTEHEKDHLAKTTVIPLDKKLMAALGK